MTNAERLDNHPGLYEDITGYELSKLMLNQAEKYGLQTLIVN